MKILHVAYPYISIPPKGYGGSERVASQIVEGLVGKGHEVHLVATGDSVTKSNLHYIYDKQLTLSKSSPYHAIKQHLFAKELVKYLGIDIVHNHMGEFGYEIIQGKRNVTTLHNDYNTRAGTCVAISQNQAQRLGLKQVVYNAIEPEKYIYSEDKEDYMLFLGNCSKAKGVETAIRISKDLNYKLIMCLKIDEGQREYFNKILKPMLKGTESLIEVKGIVSMKEKLQLYSKAKVFLMPIEWDEPFGLVMLEAMASGTPVVAYDRGSVPEVVFHYGSGLVAEPEDYDMFKTYVDASLRHPIPSKECLEQAKKFNVERMVDGYEKIYKELI